MSLSRTMSWVVVGALVALAVIGPVATAQQPQPKPPGTRVREPLHGHPGERHPALHRALRDLERAKSALETAPDVDKVGGYSARALEQTKKAIAEINSALTSFVPKK